jgi:hypothetical protein
MPEVRETAVSHQGLRGKDAPFPRGHPDAVERTNTIALMNVE